MLGFLLHSCFSDENELTFTCLSVIHALYVRQKASLGEGRNITARQLVLKLKSLVLACDPHVRRKRQWLHFCSNNAQREKSMSRLCGFSE